MRVVILHIEKSKVNSSLQEIRRGQNLNPERVELTTHLPCSSVRDALMRKSIPQAHTLKQATAYPATICLGDIFIS
jgi:hypothetical protein